MTFARATNNANDLIITLSDGGTIRVNGQFDSLGWDRVEAFQFEDVVIHWNDLGL